MFPDNSVTGWHATDDEQDVPVRNSSPALTNVSAKGPGDHIVLQHHSTLQNPAWMRLSAFFGVALVIGILGVLFGFGNIFGDLTGGSAAVTTIEITTDEVFSPSTVTLRGGDMLTIVNKNPSPQVIKSKNERQLFPTQILFDTQFDFTVPENANGTYVYFSETLPDEQTLTINITPQDTSDQNQDTPIPFGNEGDEIPIPFGETTYDTPIPFGSSSSVSSSSSSSVSSSSSSSSSSNSSSSSSSSGGGTSGGGSGGSSGGGGGGGSSGGGGGNSGGGGGGGGGSQIISVGTGYTPPPNPTTSYRNIPTNPYTVNAGGQNRIDTIAAAKDAQNLHSGAPLQEIVKHKPFTVTETGPHGTLLVILPALLAVGFLYRKMKAV